MNPNFEHRLKIDRAKRNTEEFVREAQVFWARKPFEVHQENNHAAGKFIRRVRVREHVPAQLSPIIGEAIHNLRSALDLMACAAVSANSPGADVKHIHFVIRDTEVKFNKALKDNMRGASDAAIAAIRNLQPWKDGNLTLWQLHELSLRDKHRGLIPVGAAFQGINIAGDMAVTIAQAFPDKPEFAEMARKMPIFLKPADIMFPLKDGDILFEGPLGNYGPGEVQFDVAFGEGQVIPGEMVLPALQRFTEEVERIAGIIEIEL